MNKKLKRLLHNTQDYAKQGYKKFMKYDSRDRGFIIYLVALTFFVLFTPIFFKQDGISDERVSYYLMGSFKFFVPLLLALVSLGVMLAWNISVRAKELLAALFGFKNDTFLLNFIMLILLTATYSSIGAVVSVLQSDIPTLSFGLGYKIVQLLLLGGLLYTWYMAKSTNKRGKQFHVINESFHKGSDDGDMDSMFDEMKEEHSSDKGGFTKHKSHH